MSRAHLSIESSNMSHTISRDVMLKTVPAILENTRSNVLIWLRSSKRLVISQQAITLLNFNLWRSGAKSLPHFFTKTLFYSSPLFPLLCKFLPPFQSAAGVAGPVVTPLTLPKDDSRKNFQHKACKYDLRLNGRCS